MPKSSARPIPRNTPWDVRRTPRRVAACLAVAQKGLIANAIGPRNTVGAIGIMPSTVGTAVSMIGRKRELLASIATRQTPFHPSRSEAKMQCAGHAAAPAGDQAQLETKELDDLSERTLALEKRVRMAC